VSKAREAAFGRAVEQVTGAAREMPDSLVTTAPPRDRAAEAAKARTEVAIRFGREHQASEPCGRARAPIARREACSRSAAAPGQNPFSPYLRDDNASSRGGGGEGDGDMSGGNT